MKKIKSLSFILLSAMLVSCGKISVSPDSAISASSEVSDSTEESDELLGSEESSLTEESTSTEPSDSFSEIVSDSVSDSTSEEDPDDEDEPEVDYREEDYSYHPSSPETIPSISISSDTGNDFVTVPNKDNKWDYTDCRISVSNCLEEYQLSDIEAGVKVRGNYTANYEKKPLRIKFNKKQKMLGLNQDAKAKSWVLLADYKDSSLLRNALSFYLGNTILSSDDYYSADFIPVNVTINNEYWGMYLLTEQQQINEYRVKIDDVEDRDDYQGNDIGYFFEYDGYYTEEKEDPTFKIKYQNHASYQTYQKNWVQPTQDGYTIKSTINSDSQKSFINNYLNNIYNICYQAIEKSSFREFTLNYTGINPSPIKDCEKVVSQVIDIDSLVDMYLLQELACDADIGWSSFYLSVDMSDSGNKLLTFQAPWDFDSAFGLKKNIVESAKGMYASESTNPWMSLFMKCSWFQKRVSAKWAELVKYKIFDKTIEMIDTYPVKYEESYKNNFKRWPNSIGSNSSDEVRDDIRSLKTEKECSLQLKNWYKDRISYLNSIFAA